jgi:phospholipase/lecithinase/hemolysin
MHARLDLPTSQRLFADFCHPTKVGHAIIAQRLLPDVLRLLQQPTQQQPPASPAP